MGASPIETASQGPRVAEGEIGLSTSLLTMPGLRTEHYTIYSQLSDEVTADLALRLEAMYDYYAQRFKDVYRPIPFPKRVFLFNNRKDFVAAGGHPTMPGQFIGGGDEVGARLMMIFQEGDLGAFMASCPLMYHEGFHQFRAIEISEAGNVNRAWPRWLDEGYANVFNNITWTGDGWVDGVLRPETIYSIMSNAANFITLDDLLNNDGAWLEMIADGKLWSLYMESASMVFFLDHVDSGKYRSLLARCVQELSNAQRPEQTLKDIVVLEPEYLQWLSARLNEHVTAAKYYEIFTAMLTSHVARAHARGQRFSSGDDLLAKAREGQLDMPPVGSDQWLPDGLLHEMMWYYTMLSESYDPFEVDIEYPTEGGTPLIHVRHPRFGLELEGAFKLKDSNKIASVDIVYIACPSLDLLKAMTMVNTD